MVKRYLFNKFICHCIIIKHDKIITEFSSEDWLRSPGNSNCDKGRISRSLGEAPHQARPGEGRAELGSVMVRHGPGNSDCDRTLYSISLDELPDQGDSLWRRPEVEVVV